jgi:beta-lactamase regulating signal transducer with metallopeptidase domain
MSAVIAIALIGNRLMRRQGASRRAAWMKIALALAVAIPLLSLLPPPRVTIAAVSSPVTPSQSSAPTASASEILDRPDSGWSMATMIVAIYLVGALALIARLSCGLLLLARWTARSRSLEDPRWGAAMRRVGLPDRVQLRECESITAPLSWGLFRPAILIDPRSRANAGSAVMILAHEGAHIRYLDWPALIAIRLVVACLWFNPLMWLFERALIQCCEEAADIAALRHGSGADYARILLDSARPTGLMGAAATGLTGHWLRDRIAAVLASPSLGQDYPGRGAVQAGLIIGLACCWATGLRVEPVAGIPAGVSFAPPREAKAARAEAPPSVVANASTPSHVAAAIEPRPEAATRVPAVVGEQPHGAAEALPPEQQVEAPLPDGASQLLVDLGREEWRTERAWDREEWRAARAAMRQTERARRGPAREAERARRAEARSIAYAPRSADAEDQNHQRETKRLLDLSG